MTCHRCSVSRHCCVQITPTSSLRLLSSCVHSDRLAIPLPIDEREPPLHKPIIDTTDLLTFVPSSLYLLHPSLFHVSRGRCCRRRPSGRWCPTLRQVGVSIRSETPEHRQSSTDAEPAQWSLGNWQQRWIASFGEYVARNWTLEGMHRLPLEQEQSVQRIGPWRKDNTRWDGLCFVDALRSVVEKEQNH